MERNIDEKRYAVLIDADNISSKYISVILNEMTKFGVITYKRIYGDWTTPQASKWKLELMERSITPIQQFRNTVGKNATDSTLIIDAMDILYTNNVDGFCIVSSDGDFTRLASRLRESGMDVIGMGENKTPKSFRAACSVFKDIELLTEQDDDEDNVKPKSRKAKNFLDQSKIENFIIEIITENDNKGKETGLGEIGSRLQKKYSDFDVRNFGFSSLSTFLSGIKSLSLKKTNNTVMVTLKEDDSAKENVINYAYECVKKAGKKGLELGALGQLIHNQYPDFKVKEYGYSTLSKLIISLDKLEIKSSNNKMMVMFSSKA